MKFLANAFRLLWRGLDELRRASLNMIVLALLALIVWAAWRPAAPALKDNTLLVLRLQGALVEQTSGSLRERAAIAARGGQLPRQVRLRDVLAAIDDAAHDEKVTRMLLDVDDLGAAGMVSLREVAAALQRFKAMGKPVVAWAEAYSQAQYYLAAQANEVYLHPMGQVAIEGFGRHRLYYKDLFDRLGVQAHVLRAGRFKNASEPFAANGPSPETLEADRTIYTALWALYAEGVEKARKLPAGSLATGVEQLPQLVDKAGGDLARVAQEAHLVDGLMTEDELRRHLLKMGAQAEEGGKKSAQAEPEIRQVGLGEYLAHVKRKTSGDAVAVVIAEGGIVNGDVGPGAIGGHSSAALIRAVREDDRFKALVLRVRSPGGSAFASEQVRHELELVRKAGKPVVVSMGDVAGSGGYWISLAADEVIADAATITGSIGVIGMLPSVEGALAKLGLKTGGVTTTWLGDAYDPRRGLDPRLEKIVQQSIDHAYAEFVAKTAAARKSTAEKIDAVAQGRVWTGAQALERGLVDRVGSWNDALASARQRGKLDADAPVIYLERGAGRLERVASWFIRTGGELGVDVMPAGDAASLSALGALPALSTLSDWSSSLKLTPDLTALALLLRSTTDGPGALPQPLALCGCAGF